MEVAMKRFVWLVLFFLAPVLVSASGDSQNAQQIQKARKAPVLILKGRNAPPPPDVLKSPPLPQAILDAKTSARPLESMLRSALPPRVDYSNYITLTRTQGSFGGCFLYAALYVIDIIKEMEHPYTPDLSYRYAQYYYDDKKVDQKIVHTQYGSCPEAILHTDYDALVWVTGHYDDSQCPQPTPPVDAWAKRYRIADTSPYITPTVNSLKALLIEHGPLWGMGTISNLEHCFAIIGYDDSQHAFRFINSWGDQWNGDGQGTIPYAQLGQMVSAVTYFTNMPSRRLGTSDAYTARIRISHQKSRNELTVSVGVGGQKPYVVWDRPNEGPLVDTSRNLSIDVPLPRYANKYWPPSQSNLWYVQVTDGSQNGKGAKVEEVTFVKLLQSPEGKNLPELHRPHMKMFSIPDAASRKIYVGAQPPKIELAITPEQTTISRGGAVIISGKLSVTSYDTDAPLDVAPLKRKLIKINSVSTIDSVEQSQWAPAGTTVTDGNGKFSFTAKPTANSGTITYIAVYTNPQGQIIATSNPCKATIGLKKAAPVKIDRIIKK